MIHLTDIQDVISTLDAGIALRRKVFEPGNAIIEGFTYKYNEATLAEIKQLEPLSEAYRETQLKLFEAIAGHVHTIADEGHDTEGDIANALPYYMQPADVGYWTIVYGHLLQHLKLPKMSKVLEIGFGPGGLTELLVRAGLNVTAVDCNVSNCRFVERRTAAFGGQIQTIAGDITLLDLPDQYDAIIFFESFHHMIDFWPILQKCAKHLTSSGRFLFGAEPIVNEEHPHVPLPWGIRTAGAALCALREVGWIELGFQEPFFHQMMDSLGFITQKHFLLNYHHSELRICTRK